MSAFDRLGGEGPSDHLQEESESSKGVFWSEQELWMQHYWKLLGVRSMGSSFSGDAQLCLFLFQYTYVHQRGQLEPRHLVKFGVTIIHILSEEDL